MKGSELLEDARREWEEPEYVDEDLEYKVYSFQFPEIVSSVQSRDEKIEQWLNDGWHLYNWIVCPPFVMLFFSREKEESEVKE